MSNKNWASVDVNSIPKIVTPLPGPKSVEYHSRAAKYMKGYSSQVSLFPVCFESGLATPSRMLTETNTSTSRPVFTLPVSVTAIRRSAKPLRSRQKSS